MKASFAAVGLLFLGVLSSFCVGLKEQNPIVIDGLLPTSNYDNLKALLEKIQLTNQISANTVGTKISGQLNISIGSGSLTILIVNVSLTENSLTINAKTQVWGATVLVQFVFGYDSQNNLQVDLSFIASNVDFATLYTRIVGKPAPAYLSDFSGNAQMVILLSTVTGQMNLGATVNILSGTLLQAVHFVQPAAVSANVNANLMIPIFSSDPTEIQLSVEEIGAFNIGTSIHVTEFSIFITTTAITLTADMNITTGTGAYIQYWVFDMTAGWNGLSNSIIFEGTLDSTVNPLNVAWLSLSKLAAAFEIDLPTSGPPVYNLTMTANAVVSWAPSSNPPLTAVLDLGGTGSDLSQVLLSIANIPINVLTGFYQTVVQAPAPAVLQQTVIKGDADLTISTYTSGSIKQGLTLTVPIQIQTVSGPSGNELLRAVQVLMPAATTSTFYFDFAIFSPIFGPLPASDVDLSLTERGSFNLVPDGEIVCLAFAIDIDIQGSSSSIEIDAQVGVELTNNQQLEFYLTADWQEQAQTTFTGSLIGQWVHPFGVKWLTIQTATLTLVLGSGTVPSGITLTGNAQVTWLSGPVTITLELSASSGSSVYDQLLFSITGIPLNNYDTFYSAVVQSGGTPPAVTKQTQIQGTANLYLSTYNTGTIQPGITLEVPVLITTAGGTNGNILLEAVQLLLPTATTKTFSFNFSIYVPIFGPGPIYDIDMKLQELTSFKMTSDGRVLCDGFVLNLQVEDDTIVFDIDVDISVFIKSQATPLNFSLVADFQGLESTTFSGTLTSPWDHPFGTKWLNIPTAELSLVLGGSFDPASITLTASGAVTFAPQPVDITLEISSDSNGFFDQLYIAVTNIPISSMGDMYKAVSGSDMPDVLDSVTLYQGTISFALCTYNGPAREGFTFSADVTVTNTGSNKDLYDAVAAMVPNPSQQTYLFQLYLPIFGPTFGFSVSLTETGGFSLSNSIEVNGYSVAVSDSGTDVDISLSAQLSVQLAQQNTPLLFSVSANFDSGSESVSFSGSMTGPWDHPFGVHWLTIDSASISFTVSAANLGSFAIAASGDVTFKDVSAHASFSFSTDSTFTQVCMTAEVQSLWTLSEVGTGAMDLGHYAVSTLNDVSTTADLNFEIIISTYSFGSTLAGLTIGASGKVTGDLLKTLEALSQDLDNVAFDVQVVLPIFADSTTLQLSLAFAEQIQITSNVWFEQITFALTVDTAISVSVDTTILTHWKRNPPLTFNAYGSFSTDGDVLLAGYLVGNWEHPFGCQGFNLTEVILEIGFDPTMCVIDGCISDFGVGYTMQWSETTIQFDGNAAAPDFANVFLMGSISGNNGMALTVLEVAEEWNKIAYPPVDTSLIPADWGITDTSFYFAPVDGTFGPITYTAGFGFTGGFILLDMALTLSINCTDAVGFSCNFEFNVNLNLGLFKQMIQRELGMMGKEIDIFSINSLSLTEWSQKDVANGVNPHWQMEITVFDQPNNLDFRVEQYQMAQSFHQFFDQWIAHIFGDV